MDIPNTSSLSMNGNIPPNPQYLGGMLEDNNGGTSSMRVFMLFGGGFILLVWGFAVVWSAFHGLPLPDIPLQWNLAFGTLVAGKIGQKYIEGKQ